jgi:hypothetical protein
LFVLLCLVPYFRSFFIKPAKYVFILMQLVALAFVLREQLLPFHYAAPTLAQSPDFQTEYIQAKNQPNGNGFKSFRIENNVTLWYVRKPDYDPPTVVRFLLLYLAPLTLFLLRDAEIRCCSTNSNRESQSR